LWANPLFGLSSLLTETRHQPNEEPKIIVAARPAELSVKGDDQKKDGLSASLPSSTTIAQSD
jgi:hypothetical protein